jgi:hypothetical protein
MDTVMGTIMDMVTDMGMIMQLNQTKLQFLLSFSKRTKNPKCKK